MRLCAACASVPLLLLMLPPVVSGAQTIELHSPFFNLTTSGHDLYSMGGSATFALTALILLLAALGGGLILMARFAEQLAPVYGARIKYNVITGKAVYRGRDMRALPTAEEARTQQQQQQQAAAAKQRDGGPGRQVMDVYGRQQQRPAQPSRLSQVCPRGCDDSFWCPPCLLGCSCLDWLWCGPRLCCGATSLGEWLFMRVYRSPAARWFALLGQFVLLGLDVAALGLDRWSTQDDFVLPGDDTSTQVHLRAGVLGVRAVDEFARYDCPSGAVGRTLVQCTTVEVAGGFVLAVGLLACLLVLASILWSLRLRCTLLDRAYTPRLSVLLTAHLLTVTILLLLWPLVPQLILKDVYAPDLGLDGSWGMCVASWVATLILVTYMRGQVECVSVEESNDAGAIAAERAAKAALERAEAQLAEARRSRDPYGLEGSLGASRIIRVSGAQVELAETQAQRGQWNPEGYHYAGASAAASSLPWSPSHPHPLSPGAAYAAGQLNGLTLTPRNPLGTLSLSSPLPVLQRGYHANEPIPPPQLVAPSPQAQAAVAHARREAEAERAREEEARRARRAGTATDTAGGSMSGPYTSTPHRPVLIDDAAAEGADIEVERRRRWEQWREQEEQYGGGSGGAGFPLPDLRDNGLTPATQARLFGGDGGGAQKPKGLWSHHDKEAEQQQLQHPQPYSVSRAPEPSTSPLLSLPTPSDFQHLDPAYVRAAMPLDEYDLAMISQRNQGVRTQRKVEARHQQQQQQQMHMSQGEQALRAPARLPPMTPSQYRAVVSTERDAQPNLLQPARLPPLSHRAQGGQPHSSALTPQRPLQYDQPLPSPFGRSGPQVLLQRGDTFLGAATPTPYYQYASSDPSSTAGGGGAHPFVLGSPQRQAEAQAAEQARYEARVYNFISPSPSPTHAEQQAQYQYQTQQGGASLNATSRGDVHFERTGSVYPHSSSSGGGLGDTLSSTQRDWHRLPTTSVFVGEQQQQAGTTATFAARSISPPTHLSVQVAGSDDPLNRTIPTPMPVGIQHYEDEEPKYTYGEHMHVRRGPTMAPQTPQRQTPRVASGPYSRAFQ